MGFKDSWKQLKWGDIVTLEYGKALRGYKEKTSGYPVYGTNGQIGFHNEFLSKTPGVIIGRKGAYRGVHFSKKPFYVIDTAFYIKPRNLDELDLRWAYYELLTKDINSMDSGSAIPSTSRNDFYALPVFLPPLEEQKSIANILSSLDEKIETNNQINIKLEEIAQAIFKQWFIDFEFPNEDGKPYKSSGGEMVESELGMIPRGWKVGKLLEIAEILMGQSPKSEFYNTEEDGLPFHQGVSNFGYRYPTHSTFCTQALRVAKEGSILISVRAPVGRLNIADSELIIGRGLGAINSKNNCNSYLYYLLQKTFEVEDRFGSGTIFNSITKKELEHIKILIPRAELMDSFDNIVRNLDEQILIYTKEIRVLSNLRDTLLPKLLSGEIRVPAD
ncbi:restriction endonuclease subunit S [Ammoniphilus resinae]|uniref:Type I restriction enzyme S subunit n=1 Tax=Ammoniphilus resinae TaxID=861532 RepID=A0ABS4GNY8_9BACL|nr:restriction endonuclease subunit S [Ammoniphilus resinae]MBP1931974.1 type I restriction enzyme S subunit [Ammoniphilus resinae]